MKILSERLPHEREQGPMVEVGLVPVLEFGNTLFNGEIPRNSPKISYPSVK